MKRQHWLLMFLCLAVGFMSVLAHAQDEVTTPTTDENESVVPEGTEFKLQLHTTLNSKSSKAGDRVLTTLLDPVAVEDQDVLPKGLRIDGHVGEVREAGHRGKGGYLTIVFDTVELPNGEKLAILGSLTEVFSNAGGGTPDVGPEGELKGHGASKKEQAALVIVPAAAGAAAGIGPGIALAAGGIAAAYFLPRGRQAALEAGSLIGMRLDRDVTVALAATTPKPDSQTPPKTPQP
ncbi:MAG: hypothetical protein ACLQOO_34365 [Terriglobia bacterium]